MMNIDLAISELPSKFMRIPSIRCSLPRRQCLNDIHHGLETEWFVHGQAAQNLPVQSDAAPPLHLDEARIRHAVLPHAGVHPLYPQLAKLALLHLAVAVRVLPRFFEAANGDAEATVGPPPKSLGLRDNSFVLFRGKIALLLRKIILEKLRCGG